MELNVLLINLILVGILSLNSITMSSHPYKYTYERKIEDLDEIVKIVVDSDYPLSEEELNQSWQDLLPRLKQDLIDNGYK